MSDTLADYPERGSRVGPVGEHGAEGSNPAKDPKETRFFSESKRRADSLQIRPRCGRM